ncbi:MAG TPA: hypothetical protein VH796_00640, partial [Nitrososphaeraceae archaeon]
MNMVNKHRAEQISLTNTIDIVLVFSVYRYCSPIKQRIDRTKAISGLSMKELTNNPSCVYP